MSFQRKSSVTLKSSLSRSEQIIRHSTWSSCSPQDYLTSLFFILRLSPLTHILSSAVSSIQSSHNLWYDDHFEWKVNFYKTRFDASVKVSQSQEILQKFRFWSLIHSLIRTEDFYDDLVFPSVQNGLTDSFFFVLCRFESYNLRQRVSIVNRERSVHDYDTCKTSWRDIEILLAWNQSDNMMKQEVRVWVTIMSQQLSSRTLVGPSNRHFPYALTWQWRRMESSHYVYFWWSTIIDPTLFDYDLPIRIKSHISQSISDVKSMKEMLFYSSPPSHFSFQSLWRIETVEDRKSSAKFLFWFRSWHFSYAKQFNFYLMSFSKVNENAGVATSAQFDCFQNFHILISYLSTSLPKKHATRPS